MCSVRTSVPHFSLYVVLMTPRSFVAQSLALGGIPTVRELAPPKRVELSEFLKLLCML